MPQRRLSVTQVIQLIESIALLAADLSLRHSLAMADAIVYATGRDQDAEVGTGDADLKDLSRVSMSRPFNQAFLSAIPKVFPSLVCIHTVLHDVPAIALCHRSGPPSAGSLWFGHPWRHSHKWWLFSPLDLSLSDYRLSVAPL